MCSLAICWYIVLATCSLLGVNELRKKWIYILLLWSNVFDSCDILRLFAGQAGFRRYYQEKMASPEKMPQVVCWTLLLITVLQISFASWTAVVNELEDLKVLKLEKRHCEWWFNQWINWINVLQVLVLHSFSDIAGWVKFVESEASIAYMNYGAATQSVVTISLGQGQISGALEWVSSSLANSQSLLLSSQKKSQHVIFEWFPIHAHFQMICWLILVTKPIFMGEITQVARPRWFWCS